MGRVSRRERERERRRKRWWEGMKGEKDQTKRLGSEKEKKEKTEKKEDM